MHPDAAGWGLSEQLLAAAIDALRAANWQRSGGKGPYPKPVPRPGVTPVQENYGVGPLPMDEMARFLGWEVRE